MFWDDNIDRMNNDVTRPLAGESWKRNNFYKQHHLGPTWRYATCTVHTVHHEYWWLVGEIEINPTKMTGDT